VTLAEISRSTQQSAISIQPTQHFGVCFVQHLPSKVAKRKEKSEQKSESRMENQSENQTLCRIGSISQKLQKRHRADRK